MEATGLSEQTKLSVIIPVYNEERIISNSLSELCDFLDTLHIKYEILVCDDFSNDDTLKILQNLNSHNERIRILRFSRRIGKGGTIKNAIRIARGNILLFIDADLAVDLKHIPEFIRIANENKCLVIGSRNIVKKGAYTATRRILSASYNFLVRVIFKTGLRDHQIGFKAVKTEIAKDVLDKIRSDGYIFNTEFMAYRYPQKISRNSHHL